MQAPVINALNPLPLNVEPLTKTRQAMLTDHLQGFTLTMQNGKFEPMSADSLVSIGLTPLEINSLETLNAQTGGKGFVVGNYKEENPFLKDSWDPQKQRQLIQNDHAKAVEYMRAAG